MNMNFLNSVDKDSFFVEMNLISSVRISNIDLCADRITLLKS